MARKKDRKRKKTTRPQTANPETPEPQGDLAALWQNVKENPVLYTVGAAFVIACALAGTLYRVSITAQQRQYTTAFARALDTDNPALMAAQLEPLTQGAGAMTDDALYMMGEAAWRNGDYAKAKEAFERLRKEHPDSEYVPDAVEGVGYVAENEGQYETALAVFREILDKWPGSFTGRRQPFNIARCQERLGNLEQAVESYRIQLDTFPGSNVFAKASAALDRLRSTNPELFPEPVQSDDEAPGAMIGPPASADILGASETIAQPEPTSGEAAADTADAPDEAALEPQT